MLVQRKSKETIQHIAIGRGTTQILHLYKICYPIGERERKKIEQ